MAIDKFSELFFAEYPSYTPNLEDKRIADLRFILGFNLVNRAIGSQYQFKDVTKYLVENCRRTLTDFLHEDGRYKIQFVLSPFQSGVEVTIIAYDTTPSEPRHHSSAHSTH